MMREEIPSIENRANPTRRLPLWGKLLVPLGALVIVSGFVHVVHGGSAGLTVCGKDGWALQHTFVDVDDYVGRPLISMMDKAAVIRALAECGVIRTPAQVREDFQELLRDVVPSVQGKIESERFGIIKLYAPDEGCDRIRERVVGTAVPAGTKLECASIARGTQWRLTEENGSLSSE